jgi:hypothetical protein
MSTQLAEKIADVLCLSIINDVLSGKDSLKRAMTCAAYPIMSMIYDAKREEAKEDQKNNPTHNYPIYGIGKTARDACENWASMHRDRGVIENFEFETHLLNEAKGDYDWEATFTANGTSIKTAGRFIEGAFIMTWWK